MISEVRGKSLISGIAGNRGECSHLFKREPRRIPRPTVRRAVDLGIPLLPSAGTESHSPDDEMNRDDIIGRRLVEGVGCIKRG